MVSSAVQVRVETPGCGLHSNDVWAVVETLLTQDSPTAATL